MKAIRVTEYGGPEVLRLQEIETPVPGPGEVRVRLHAAGLNFADVVQRRGDFPVALPYTAGLEGAGIVEALGDDEGQVKMGDRVAFNGTLGAYAEAIVLPADRLIPLPPGLSFEEGAAFPLQTLSAHYLLHEFRLLKPGVTVLIHAAAGGMGLLLVQWAKHLGARVIGTVSTEEKAEAARAAGADHTILYTHQDFVAETKRLTGGEGVHLIIDGVGKSTFQGNLAAAALRGTIVIYGAASGPAGPVAPNALMFRSLTISGGMLPNYMLHPEERQRRLRDVLEGLTAGWLKLRIDRTLPLAEASEAHRLLEGRHSIGKIVLLT